MDNNAQQLTAAINALAAMATAIPPAAPVPLAAPPPPPLALPYEGGALNLSTQPDILSWFQPLP